MRNRNLEHDWTLSSVGKPEAEPGSPEWAIYTRARIQELLGERESSIEHLSYAWDAMIKHEGWRHLYSHKKQPFASFENFCFEPKPWGLGYKREAIEQIIKERKAARGGQLGNQNALKSYTLGYKEDNNKNESLIRSGRKSCGYLKRAQGAWMKMTEEERVIFQDWIEHL